MAASARRKCPCTWPSTKERPDIHAVVHAHPPTATGFAVAGKALNLGILPELIVSFGSVPLAEYGLPGTPALIEGMLPFIPKYNAILLANHGAVAYAQDLMHAFARMETIEHLARISLVAEMLGGPKLLPRPEIAKLFAARSRYGVGVRPISSSLEIRWPPRTRRSARRNSKLPAAS